MMYAYSIQDFQLPLICFGLVY